MESRRQLAIQRKAEEERAKILEEERKMKEEAERRKKEREELTDKRPIKYAVKKKVIEIIIFYRTVRLMPKHVYIGG